jgi:LPS-assembly protein
MAFLPILVIAAPEEDRWHLCPPLNLLPPPDTAQALPSDGEIFAHADNIESLGNNISKLSGDVMIIREQDRFGAGQAIYDSGLGRFELSGDVAYWSEQFEFRAESMTADEGSELGDIRGARFLFTPNRLSGRADSITRKGTASTLLKNSSYTTCDPDKPDWLLRAKEITLNHDSGQGLAKHMSLRFKDVPFFYFPVISFPIDDRRKSGFLYPNIGNSNSHGAEIVAPYYWNIAPQVDATITPHQMSRRGVKLDTEWRYLNRWSRNQLDAEYLDDEVYGDRRSLFRLTHKGQFTDNWRTYIDASAVSDADYFDSFGGNLYDSSINALPRDASLTGDWQHWSFKTRLLTYQTLDDTVPAATRPYRLHPELSLNGLYPDVWAGFDFEMRNSYTQFEQTDRPSVNRFDITPRLSRPMGNLGWFVIPAVSINHASYRVDSTVDPDDPDSPNRTTPIFSLDSGLFFERFIGKQQRFLQTLEPRIFYLYSPFRDQNDIPIFDTSLPDFNFAQLFAENRFLGADRIGDADQYTASLTTRFLSRDSGREFLRAGLGRIFYNQDREVTLPGGQVDTRETSNLIGEISASPSKRWNTSLMAEWDSETGNADKKLFRVRYNRDNRHIANIGYRFREAEQLEQAEASFSWAVSQRWSLAGRWNHSLQDEVNLEKFLGVVYESCCYAIRIVAREYMTGEDRMNDSIYIQLSLKGLGGVGSDPRQTLERGIPGYRDSFY